MNSRTCRLSSGVLRTGRRLLHTWRAARALSCPLAVGGRALRGRELCGGASTPVQPDSCWLGAWTKYVSLLRRVFASSTFGVVKDSIWVMGDKGEVM